jgi:hypothetical protein
LQSIKNLAKMLFSFYYWHSTSLKHKKENWIIRFAYEPFVGGLQIISNLRNFVAGFFMPSTSRMRAWLGFGYEKTHEKFSWVFSLGGELGTTISAQDIIQQFDDI